MAKAEAVGMHSLFGYVCHRNSHCVPVVKTWTRNSHCAPVVKIWTKGVEDELKSQQQRLPVRSDGHCNEIIPL